MATLPYFTSITSTLRNHGGNCKHEVAKTGLGSSAAMTTAVVAALLHYLGKVGSGFDVSLLSMGVSIMFVFTRSASLLGSLSLSLILYVLLVTLAGLLTYLGSYKTSCNVAGCSERDAIRGITRRTGNWGSSTPSMIEPESQTQLLDASMNIEGVSLADVPGAGGFDAVFAVTLGDSSRNVTNAWSLHNVLALLAREDPKGVCLESGDPQCREITSAVSSVNIK
ncbi:Tetratricopeptide repeat-like superfamily protein [Hibiscus syriacus]|uniref:phosphomevalonate kinase n=1 Tax=Hibiscus syriacus TaxID=106335 RepID=A0A6A3AFU1_HIBSY|nr:Tetratricopeptide repeat-like superfamily protein [Hibiscus syriacus]